MATTQRTIRQFSHTEDPAAAERCAQIIAEVLSALVLLSAHDKRVACRIVANKALDHELGPHQGAQDNMGAAKRRACMLPPTHWWRT